MDYYVATNGGNGNTGTESSPWETIAYSALHAQAGDTVHIKGGNYGHEHVVIGNSGNIDDTIAFKGYNGEVIIDGEDRVGIGIYLNNVSHIKISGINPTLYNTGIEGARCDNITIHDCSIYRVDFYGILFKTGAHHNLIYNILAYNCDMCGIGLYNGRYTIIRNCHSYSLADVTDHTDYAFAVSGNSYNNIIHDCVAGIPFEDGGYQISHGFAFRHGASNNKVIDCISHYTGCEHFKATEDGDGNEFIRCHGIGSYEPWYTAGFQIASSGNTVKNCVATGCNYGVLVTRSSAESSVPPVSDNNIINGVFINNGDGIRIMATGDPRPDNTTIRNNIVTGNTLNGIVIQSDVTNTHMSYNNVWGNADNYDGCSPGSGDISVNPLFIDVDNNDYHLMPDSPCIDAGDPTDDYSNEPSPNGGRINMGAYGNTVDATRSNGEENMTYTQQITIQNSDPITIDVPVEESSVYVTFLDMGEPMADKTTELLSEDESVVLQTVVTGTDGTALYTDVLHGNYSVRITY